MPPPLASATATCLAIRWILDALAGDEALDFSTLKTLVSTSPECLTGAPDATRERVALRCMQEVAPLVAPGSDAAATAGVLRVEAARSCEEMLLELIGKVGRSGILGKLPPFSQDIQNIICMKKPTLRETSFELLNQVNLEVASLVPPSLLEQNDSSQHDNDQSLCSSHDHVYKDNAEFQEETSVNLIDEKEPRNLEKDPIEPTFVPREPCTSDHLQEDDAGASVSVASSQDPETSLVMDENVPLGNASATCDAILQGNTTEPLSKKESEVHPAMVQPQSPKKMKPSNEGLETDVAAEDHTLDRSCDALPTNASEPVKFPKSVTQEDMTMISEPHSSRNDMDVLQHESGDKVNQVLDDVCASSHPAEKDQVHELLTRPSVSCNDAIQGGQSETNRSPGKATEHTTVFEVQIGDKSHIESSGAHKVNESPHDDASILEKTTCHVGLHVQATSLSQNCNLALHDKPAEADCSYEQNTGKSRSDAEKNRCSTYVPNITRNGTGTSRTDTSNNRNLGGASAEVPHVSFPDDSLHCIAPAGKSTAKRMLFGHKDQETNDSLEVLSQQDLCIKCGKAGQLLKCSGCLLAAHDSCFGLSVTSQESDLFYCPVCFYTKATEAYQKARKTYYEARKNLATFLGTTQMVGQHDELATGVLPSAINREVSDSSKRKNTHQHEGANLAHQDEEPDQQRKKQKVYATGQGCPAEIVTEKASPVQNSNIETVNKHSVHKDNSANQVQDAERQQLGENNGTGNGNLSNETRCSSQNRSEADREDGPSKSHQSNDSDEIEATSSNDSGKQSSPPWRKTRHSKSGLLGKATVAPSNSRKTIPQQDQHVCSPSRKRNYAPQKRYSNPVASTGRRTKLKWTEEEEAALKEAMAKFVGQDVGPIPWVRILEYGRNVFHRTRLPSDLRVKWRNIMKKAGS